MTPPPEWLKTEWVDPGTGSVLVQLERAGAQSGSQSELLFLGTILVRTPEGVTPIQFDIPATTRAVAGKNFPAAAEAAFRKFQLDYQAAQLRSSLILPQSAHPS